MLKAGDFAEVSITTWNGSVTGIVKFTPNSLVMQDELKKKVIQVWLDVLLSHGQESYSYEERLLSQEGRDKLVAELKREVLLPLKEEIMSWHKESEAEDA